MIIFVFSIFECFCHDIFVNRGKECSGKEFPMSKYSLQKFCMCVCMRARVRARMCTFLTRGGLKTDRSILTNFFRHIEHD